jgi:hypothetical protein
VILAKFFKNKFNLHFFPKNRPRERKKPGKFKIQILSNRKRTFSPSIGWEEK